ncbi:MAG TPA: hypothetical protein VKA84_25260 [Gemmatimonadaceae bacterium]|nr:hypothetical protein [Gemmatimonadaceae bacterium]
MYSTCLFCNASLGANEAVEHFPVGRRLAFDAEKGRLWVVCTKCGRWNLTPLEERWEAIEECERLFRDTRTRMSTDNIGLARAKEGLELVRIGRPERPEFAAWRYGDQFGRRRTRMLIGVGAAVAIGGVALATGAFALLKAAVPGGGILYQLPNMYNLYRSTRMVHARVPDDEGRTLVIRGSHLNTAQLFQRRDDPRWRLHVTHDDGTTDLTGDAALRVLSRLLANFNQTGGSRATVSDAVGRLTTHGGPEGLLASVASRARVPEYVVAGSWGSKRDVPNAVRRIPTADRLALEMAANEEQERRAMEGELAALEAAWKDAEEIAAIADDMFLPRRVGEWVERRKKK